MVMRSIERCRNKVDRRGLTGRMLRGIPKISKPTMAARSLRKENKNMVLELLHGLYTIKQLLRPIYLLPTKTGPMAGQKSLYCYFIFAQNDTSLVAVICLFSTKCVTPSPAKFVCLIVTRAKKGEGERIVKQTNQYLPGPFHHHHRPLRE